MPLKVSIFINCFLEVLYSSVSSFHQKLFKIGVFGLLGGLVKHLTLDFSSGYDPSVVGLSPVSLPLRRPPPKILNYFIFYMQISLHSIKILLNSGLSVPFNLDYHLRSYIIHSLIFLVLRTQHSFL